MTRTETLTDFHGIDGRTAFPGASEDTILAMAQKARECVDFVHKMSRKLADEGTPVPYSAAQTEYGCDWRWGNGTVTRDEHGNQVFDDDDEPQAQVFDCDGNVLVNLTLGQSGEIDGFDPMKLGLV